MTKGPGNGVRVLRTVYLPHEQTDTLLLTIEALRTQLEEQSKVALDRTKSLEEQSIISFSSFHPLLLFSSSLFSSLSSLLDYFF